MKDRPARIEYLPTNLSRVCQGNENPHSFKVLDNEGTELRRPIFETKSDMARAAAGYVSEYGVIAVDSDDEDASWRTWKPAAP